MALKIVLVGKPNSGQVQTAVYLKESYAFKRVKLMDGVIRICQFLYHYKKYQRTPWVKRRAIYDAFYKIDPNIWITYLLFRLVKTTNRVVVEDPKFLNELDQLQKAGFITIRLIGEDRERSDSIGKYLGKEVIGGTIVMSEYFQTDISKGARVDYNIHYSSRQAMKKAIDELMTQLLTNE